MDLALKQRLVGAIVLIALAVIFLPMILDGAGRTEPQGIGVEIPPRADAPASQFDVPDVEAELETDAGGEAATDTAATGGQEGAAEPGPAATAWVVQVGSFSKEANAVVLRDQLRDDGFAAFVAEGVAEGQPVWRVRVGPLAEEPEARRIARRIRDEREQAALVMSYP